jgi:hypothetical protein
MLEAVLPKLWPTYHAKPTEFLRLARLQAVFALKATQTVEHILALTLGPISKNGVLAILLRLSAVLRNVLVLHGNFISHCNFLRKTTWPEFQPALPRGLVDLCLKSFDLGSLG